MVENEENNCSIYLAWHGEGQGQMPIQARLSFTLLNQLNPLRSIVKEACHGFDLSSRRVDFKNFVGVDTLNGTSGFLVRDTIRLKLWVKARYPQGSEIVSKCLENEPAYVVSGISHYIMNSDFAAPVYLLYNINAFRKVRSKLLKISLS